MAEETIEENKEESQTSAPDQSENEARKMGWVGKEEFKGDPGKWRPANEWLDRGKRILPIVLKDNERLQRNLDRLKDQLSEMRDSTKELLEFHKKSEERAYERARKELMAKAEAATANADVVGARVAIQEMDDLAKQHAAATVKTEPKRETSGAQIDPVIQDWIANNDWFNRDEALKGFASRTYDRLARSHPGASKAEILAETKRLTVEKFPEDFNINPARETARTVAEPSGGTVGRKRGKTYDDLPEEAKKACEKFIKTIPGYKREQYLADYNWEG